MNKKLVLGVLLMVSSLTFAQKNNTTNAAMEYKHYQESIAGGDVEQAAKDIWEAKKYIDLSAAHETTMNDPKTLMYKGKIYIEIMQVGMMANNQDILSLDTTAIMTEGFETMKKAYEIDQKGKGRYEDDIEGYCNMNKTQYFNMGINMYQAEKFVESAAGFYGAAQFSDIIGVTDSLAYYNAGLAANKGEVHELAQEAFEMSVNINYNMNGSVIYLVESYKAQEKFEEGETFLHEALKKYPGNKDIMIGLINLYLPQGKKAEAESVLTDAIALDPENKELHYVVGTVYEGQERYEDAEKAYKKVLELDPEYTDALLGLGAVYFNMAADYNNKINELQPGDPKEGEYRAAMKSNFEKALPYLEKADELNPNSKEILNSLKQVYYKLEMTDKFMETKAKIEAL